MPIVPGRTSAVPPTAPPRRPPPVLPHPGPQPADVEPQQDAEVTEQRAVELPAEPAED